MLRVNYLSINRCFFKKNEIAFSKLHLSIVQGLKEIIEGNSKYLSLIFLYFEDLTS